MLTINVIENIRVGISENLCLHKSNKNHGKDCRNKLLRTLEINQKLGKIKYFFEENNG